MDLNKYCKKKKKQLLSCRKKIAFKLYENIEKNTPVDTGRARGNWFVDIHDNATKIDENARQPQYSSEEQLPAIKGDESIFIFNNLPYIRALEFGHSKQAPQGMVGITLANAERYVQEAIQESKGE